MRNQIKIPILALTIISLSGLTAQAQSLDLSGTADCDGWSTVSTLTFPAGIFSADLEYSVVLHDQSGVDVDRFDWVGQVSRYENPVMMMMQGGSWNLTLDSVYTADFSFYFLGEEKTLNVDLVCGDGDSEPEPETEPVVEPCRKPSGFWKTHADAWPAQILTIGGLDMDRDQLIQIMKKRVRGNGSLLLARELVAAKLNVANGCDDSISPVIEEADLFLIEHPLSDSFWRHRVPSSRDLRQALSSYNKAGCSESESDEGGILREFRVKSAAIEQKNFGALKAMYR